LSPVMCHLISSQTDRQTVDLSPQLSRHFSSASGQRGASTHPDLKM